MRRMLLTIITITFIFLVALTSPLIAQDNAGCNIGDDVFNDIRRMFTAEDNGKFFELWSDHELYCACYEILYNEPEDAWLHDRVAVGAVVIISQTSDPRAVDVLIDQIDKYPAQALYNLSRWPTVASVNALSDNIRNENVEARENAAEGMRNMRVPLDSEIEDGWVDALKAAMDEVSVWMLVEPEPDVADYFLDAHTNLANLLNRATSALSNVE